MQERSNVIARVSGLIRGITGVNFALVVLDHLQLQMVNVWVVSYWVLVSSIGLLFLWLFEATVAGFSRHIARTEIMRTRVDLLFVVAWWITFWLLVELAY